MGIDVIDINIHPSTITLFTPQKSPCELLGIH